MPDIDSKSISEIANQVSYGWGVIPSDVTIAGSTFYTALIPKDGSYLAPLKKIVRQSTNIDLGDKVKVKIQIPSSS